MEGSPTGVQHGVAETKISAKLQSDSIFPKKRKDAPEAPKHKGLAWLADTRLSRKDFILLSVGVGIASTSLGSIAGGSLRGIEYGSVNPLPKLEGDLSSKEGKVRKIREVIDSRQPFTYEYATDFARKLVAPLFVEQGKELGYPRNLNLEQLMQNSTFIPDFSNPAEGKWYNADAYKSMQQLAQRLGNPSAVSNAELDGAFLWTFLEEVHDSYYQTIKHDYDAKRALLQGIYASGFDSYTDFHNGGHTFFNISGMNGYGREFHDSNDSPGYYLGYQRPNIEENPQECRPITYGAVMLQLLMHEWEHLDSQQGLPSIPDGLSPCKNDSVMVEALKKNGYDLEAQNPPIIQLDTFNFGLIGLGDDKKAHLFASGLLEVTTDMLTTRLIASLGLPTVLTYHSGMDYKNMHTLLKHMGMEWKDLAVLYYNSQIEEFYRRLGDVLLVDNPTASDVDKVAAGIRVFSPNTVVESPFPWRYADGTQAGINWAEIYKRVPGIDPQSYIELHQPYSDVPGGVGNWWAYAFLEGYNMEQAVGSTHI